MAFYADKTSVKESNKPERYSKLWKPGANPTYAGIYKCQRCGFEDVINRECESMPPCSECRQQSTTWKLLVRAEDKE